MGKTEKPPCFGSYGRPTLKHLTCDNCTENALCKRQLLNRVQKCIQIEFARRRARITVDLIGTSFDLKTDAVNRLHELFAKFAGKGDYSTTSKTRCYFSILKEVSEKFVAELQEIVCNIENLTPID